MVGDAVGLESMIGRRTATAASGASGEVAAFATLVDLHHAGLVRFLTRQTGEPELAADLAQETFLAAFRHRHQLADPSAFAAWLFGIARNQLKMEWRRRRLRRAISLDWLPLGLENGNHALQRADAVATTVERDQIQRALDALSPPLREALLLHSLCGFSGGEVGTILGISPDAARKRIARAEAAFRRGYEARVGQAEEASDALR